VEEGWAIRCEYMNRGMVVVLDRPAQLPAACPPGWSYVLDEDGGFEKRWPIVDGACEPVPEELTAWTARMTCRKVNGRVHFNHLNQADEQALRDQIEKHLHYTGSPREGHILDTGRPIFTSSPR